MVAAGPPAGLVRLCRQGGRLEGAPAAGVCQRFAGVIDPASKAQLETYCGVVEQSTGAQMALVTIASLEGEPIEDVANTHLPRWGVARRQE